MTNLQSRLFHDDAAIRHLGEGLVACDLRREEWTHEAHLAATLYLARERPEIALESAVPGLIRRFNESVGGVNDDSQGYHETITQVFLHGVRLHLSECDAEMPLVDCVNALLASDRGRRDWPLRFYTRERLFSVAARLTFIPPDKSSFEY